MSDIDYTNGAVFALPKPESRKNAKAAKRERYADFVAKVRAYVFGRERDICRCCRMRRAESMHELIFKSVGGKVSRRNSIAVCGSGTTGCHGELQQHRIIFGGDDLRAESTLTFTPITARAAEWLRIALGQRIVSAPMREYETEREVR